VSTLSSENDFARLAFGSPILVVLHVEDNDLICARLGSSAISVIGLIMVCLAVNHDDVVGEVNQSLGTLLGYSLLTGDNHHSQCLE